MLDARQGREPLGGLLVVLEIAATDLVDDDVAIEAQNLVEQLLAEAVHHGHHGDEREHAKQDAQEREAGQHGDEPLLAAGAQIAQRQHPLEGCKGFGVARLRARADQTKFPLLLLRPCQASTRRALTSSMRRSTAASVVMVMRSPDLRSLTSISPPLSPLGPTIN